MKRNQSGFTLIEIAIVLVIIGLLLGGVLKGQELINSAKVKNLAGEFKNVALFINSFQDKFRALPGDDALANTHVTGAIVATAITAGDLGNGRIDGKWDSQTVTHESFLFWQHVRLSGIATGTTTYADAAQIAAYLQRNTIGGRMGITNNSVADLPIATLRGSYIVCSDAILGKFAKQLDILLDDGNGASGSLMAAVNTGPLAVGLAGVAAPLDDTLYLVCYGV